MIKWEDPPAQLNPEQMAEVFAKIEVKKPEKKKSLLTEQLENCPNLPHRQYLEYAKFDGTAQLGLPVKSFKIFMTILPEKHQNYPLIVCVIANAKIKDLIGFTCYKYRYNFLLHFFIKFYPLIIYYLLIHKLLCTFIINVLCIYLA